MTSDPKYEKFHHHNQMQSYGWLANLGDGNIASETPCNFCHSQLERAFGNTNPNAPAHSNLKVYQQLH
jgi:cbb3-type cytochrome oxidase cytochrome c subunit